MAGEGDLKRGNDGPEWQVPSAHLWRLWAANLQAYSRSPKPQNGSLGR
jgi:hypothetical protein